jgi:hypothetical protein
VFDKEYPTACAVGAGIVVLLTREHFIAHGTVSLGSWAALLAIGLVLAALKMAKRAGMFRDRAG